MTAGALADEDAALRGGRRRGSARTRNGIRPDVNAAKAAGRRVTNHPPRGACTDR
jgi:hypothetical protein